MRLEPIEKPRGLMLRIAHWMSRRSLGAVPSSITVIYARAPKLATPGYQLVRTLEKGLSLDPELKLLILVQSSLLNGCSFCADLHQAQAARSKLGLGRFEALRDYETSDRFSERERAVLAYTDCLVLDGGRVPDGTFEALASFLSHEEILELSYITLTYDLHATLCRALRLEYDDVDERITEIPAP